MFNRSFIDLLHIYYNINKYASNKLANNSLLYMNTFQNNLFEVNEYLRLTTIYKDFISYYDDWFITYFIK